MGFGTILYVHLLLKPAYAPHEEDRILRLPVVGKIVGRSAQGKKPPHLAAFYFMTFLNLFLVLAVLLIIAVWRWGWGPGSTPGMAIFIP